MFAAGPIVLEHQAFAEHHPLRKGSGDSLQRLGSKMIKSTYFTKGTFLGRHPSVNANNRHLSNEAILYE